MSARIAITGAAGFVGRAVVEAALARGHRPVAVVRGQTGFAAGVEVRPVGDLAGETAQARAVEGCDAVIHLAGQVRVPRPDRARAEEILGRQNVDVTIGLLQAAAQAGIRRFVHASSVAIFGSATADGAVVDDDAPFAPVNAYGRSKLEAERRLMARATELGISAIALRPPAVFGPGVQSPFTLLMTAVRKGAPLPLGRVRNRRSFIYVENLAEAFVAAVESEAAGAFLVTDSDPLSSAELVRRIAAAMGARPRLVPVPVGLMRAAAKGLGQGQTADSLLGSMALDGGRFRQATGWRPTVAFDEAIERTVKAFVARP